MKRAKLFAAVIYGMLVLGTIVFVNYPDLMADEAQVQAKISAAQARETALRAVPGTVKSSELETEHGRLIYSFEIKRAGERGITEVNVSATDGSIVDVHREHAGNNRKVEHAQLNPESANHRNEL
jgi:Peptidase propeptide and YPEB domain/Esterase FrsA-like